MQTNFVSKYLNWSYMCAEQFKDTKVVEIVEEEVKNPLKELLKKFRVGKTYLE